MYTIFNIFKILVINHKYKYKKLKMEYIFKRNAVIEVNDNSLTCFGAIIKQQPI